MTGGIYYQSRLPKAARRTTLDLSRVTSMLRAAQGEGRCFQWAFPSPGYFAPLLLLIFVAGASSQVPLARSPSGAIRIFNTDMAVLEIQDRRQDLPCSVEPGKPLLGFDLRFHAGYEATVPLSELAGSENLLTILFRVYPVKRPEDAVYFVQKLRVPSIEDDAKGNAYLQGYFDIGEGDYHVDWLMRDRSERVCSFYWDTQASMPEKDKEIQLAIGAGVIEPIEFQQFTEEPPVERDHTSPPLNVKVLVNFAPQKQHAATLQPLDTSALISILRSISREPRIGKFSIVAFNLQEQRVIYRQENADRIDFPALGEALDSLNLGTVDLKRLSEKHGETQFLAQLLQRELSTEPAPPDAVVFAGPKALLEANVQQDTLAEFGQVEYPVFYMNYNLYPNAIPWRDSIGHAVRFFKGYEYTISRPRDLWYAVTEMVSRIVKSKHGRQTSAASTQ